MNAFEWILGSFDEKDCRQTGLIIFGAGLYGMWASYFFREGGVPVISIFDNNAPNVRYFSKVEISFPRKCEDVNAPIVIAVSDPDVEDEMRKEARMLGYRSIYSIDIKKLTERMDAIPDDKYLEIRFYMRMGSELRLKKPETFNEKLNWIKLNDRNPLYTTMADKYAVKDYVAKIIGKEYVVPTLGIWDSFDDIDFDRLPERFVLKCTHDSGSVIICKNKKQFDIDGAKRKLGNALKKNYYLMEREWPYRDVPRKIMAEQYIESNTEILDVYKIFNFMGKPELIQMIQDDKTENETIDYFDTEWNLLDLRQNFPNSSEHRKKPEKLEDMLRLAGMLSKGIPFVRTDFYIDGKRILFSEFTFFSDSGCERFHPDGWDKKLGKLIDLPENK